MPPAAKRTAAHTHHRWCRPCANQHRRNNSGSAGKDSRPPGLGSSWRRGCPFYWKRAQPRVPGGSRWCRVACGGGAPAANGYPRFLYPSNGTVANVPHVRRRFGLLAKILTSTLQAKILSRFIQLFSSSVTFTNASVHHISSIPVRTTGRGSDRNGSAHHTCPLGLSHAR